MHDKLGGSLLAGNKSKAEV